MVLSGRTQTLAYAILDCLQVIRDLGFDGVEICLESEDIAPGVLDVDLARRIRDRVEQLGLSPHAVSYHKDYIHNDALFAETKKAIRLTPEFGTDLFIFSGGGKTGARGEWQRNVERTRELVEIAAGHGVILAEEFEPNFVVGSTADLHRLFNEISSLHLAANLDLGHVFLCDPDPMAAIASLEGRIRHCHVENMAIGVHKHLPPDEGDMDLRQYVAALHGVGFAGPLALDLYNCDYEAIARRTIPHMRRLIEQQEKTNGQGTD